MEGPPSKKRRRDVDEERKRKALRFHQAIIADITDVNSQEGDDKNLIEGVMTNVPHHFTEAVRNIIIRKADFLFWTSMLRELAEEDASRRVVAVGSPGIGKSTTTAFAIRLLLQKGKTVVYKYRTEDDSGYYVEYTPSKEGLHQVNIEVYPEEKKGSEIPSLLDPETYYVVDPGITKTSCSPGPFVVSRVIIVASPDERHWGGSGFLKDTDTGLLGGEIRYFPAWSLRELQAASTRLSNVQFKNGEVAELHSIFGGIPRQVFAPSRRARNCEQLRTKVEAIPDQKLRNLVTGQINHHSGFGANQPGGGVVEFVPKNNFKSVELKLVSTFVLKWVRNRFMDSIWTPMAVYPSPMSWQLLEDYVLHALQNRNEYTARPCVGKSDRAYSNIHVLDLGGCTEATMTTDCTASVLGGPELTLFYSSDKHRPLYDVIYKAGRVYHAFQITQGKSHDAKQHQINSLIKRLQIGVDGKEFRLYYAVHEAVFDSFVTNPVTPVSVAGVSIKHLKLSQGLLA